MMDVEPSWQSPPRGPTLPVGHLHLWRASLDRPADRLEEMWQSLSADERRRAGNLRLERDTWRYVAGRGILRSILGRYLAEDPGLIAFQYGQQGKPALAEGFGDAGLEFSLSHSGALALFALVHQRAVGVDLEQVRHLPDEDAMAARFFSAEEYAAYRKLPPDQQTLAFFQCWTRKEAYLKALGDGLTRDLSSFDVSLAPGEPARLLRVVAWDPAEAGRWSLISLVPAAGFVAAVAVQGPTPEPTFWDYV